MRFYLSVFGLLGLCSCGYHSVSGEGESFSPVTVSIPYIPGDPDAVLNNELVYQLSAGGRFICKQTGGDYVLQVRLLSDTKSRIGFRYDSDNMTGALEKNLLGVEDRRSVSAEVSVIESRSNKVVVSPFEVRGEVDYDYIDPGSPKDLIYKGASGSSQSVIQFSLGQLDSYEGAYDGTSAPVFRKLAERIEIALSNYFSERT